MLTREFLLSLGFTDIIKEEVTTNSHWFVARHPKLNARVSLNLKTRNSSRPLNITLQLDGTLVYKGRITPSLFLTIFLLLTIDYSHRL